MQALIVFAKIPRPGRVKTRLTTVLTEADACRLYTAFLRDALAQYGALEADVRLYLGPPPAPIPDGLVPAGVTVRWQSGEGLGVRMARAFVETFAAGYERVVVIGTDHPTLPSAFIEQAFASLAEPPSLCLGPSDDGGYYLLGMNEPYTSVFEGMTYSHAEVFRQTLERCAATPASTTVLPVWYDVDTPDALRRLAADLAAPGVEAPHTRRVMKELVAAYPALAD
jgi:rSAM/selenodomain-associated transferase 1